MILKIKTNDCHIVQVEEEDIMISNLISMVAQSICENEKEEIPLYNVSFSIFLKILEYTRHYKREPMKIIPKPLTQDGGLGVQQWYMDYLSTLKEETLYELLKASTYLDIEPLQHLLCARIASFITGKECNELKEIFGFNYETM